MKWIFLATEDQVSEAVCRVLIGEVSHRLVVGQAVRKNGFGYLKSRIRNFCEIARSQPVLVVTDLDTAECPIALMKKWFVNDERTEAFVFRVAVREIEAWILADHQGMRKWMGERAGILPRAPDDLPDPKATLLQLARHAPASIRTEMVAEEGAVASQGLGYNDLVVRFVHTDWNPARAASLSPSLNRARLRIRELADRA